MGWQNMVSDLELITVAKGVGREVFDTPSIPPPAVAGVSFPTKLQCYELHLSNLDEIILGTSLSLALL